MNDKHEIAARVLPIRPMATHRCKRCGGSCGDSANPAVSVWPGEDDPVEWDGLWCMRCAQANDKVRADLDDEAK